MEIDAGHEFLILNFALTTDFSSITTTRAFRQAFIQLKEDEIVTVRKSATDTTEFTLKAGSGLILRTHQIREAGDTTTICQAKIATGTGTLEVLLIL